MRTIKGLLLITLLAFFTSCGKGEPIGDIGKVAKKATVDTINTVAKASIDTLKTTKKAVDDTLREGGEVASKVGEAGEQIVEGSDDLVNGAGKLVEKVGQIPRNLGNALLGTDSSTDEDLKDLQHEVDALRAEMRASFYEARLGRIELSEELAEVNTELSQRIDDAIQKAEDELAIEVDELEQELSKKYNKSVINEKYNELLSKIDFNKTFMENLELSVNNLKAFCESDLVYDNRWVGPFRISILEGVETACELGQPVE